MKPSQLTAKSLAEAAAYLARQDSDLAPILRTYGPPPMWSRKPGFATLVHIILEQQVSLASAASMFARLQQHINPLEPERVLELGETQLRTLGLTRQKTTYCLHLAETVATRQLKLEGFARLDDEAVRKTLMQVKGIGAWSADVYLLMVLRRPDIWPTGDLALATAAFSVKRLKERPTPEVLTRLAEPWRPFRSVAARMLWQSYLARRAEVR
jgi:DNA-3-methyladenine glycosylase II